MVVKISNVGHWRMLWSEISDRMVAPTRHPSFIIFFLLTVILISPAGIWLELYRFVSSPQSSSSGALLTAIATFSPALMTTSCLQVIWGKPLPSFRAFLIFVSIVSGLGWSFFVAGSLEESTSYKLGVGLSLVALLVWWMSNAKQQDLLDTYDYSASIGGENLDTELSGTGDLHDFNH